MWVSRGCEIVNILEHKKRLQTKVENPVSNHSSNRKPRTQKAGNGEGTHKLSTPPSLQPTWHLNCFCSRSWGPRSFYQGSLLVDRSGKELQCRQQFSVTTLVLTLMAQPIYTLWITHSNTLLITHSALSGVTSVMHTHAQTHTHRQTYGCRSCIIKCTHSSWDLICYPVMVLMWVMLLTHRCCYL